MVDTPVALDGSSSRRSSAWKRSATMQTQRCSIAAVAGYSSLSIMFLSNVSAISFSACGIHPRGDERREVQPRAAVEHQLVVDEPVGVCRDPSPRPATAAMGWAPYPAGRCMPGRSAVCECACATWKFLSVRDWRWPPGHGRGCATLTSAPGAARGRRLTGWRRGRGQRPPRRRPRLPVARPPAARR